MPMGTPQDAQAPGTDAARPTARKVRVNGEEATLHITEKSVLFESGTGGVTGFERSAIRMVAKNQEGDIVIAYADGSIVKSVTVSVIEGDSSELLFSDALKEHLGPSVLDEEMERMFIRDRDLLLKKLENMKNGMTDPLTKEEDKRIGRDRSTMYEAWGNKFEKEFPSEKTLWVGPWNLLEYPREHQVSWAKERCLAELQFFVKATAEMLRGPSLGLNPNFTGDSHGMLPEDWEKLFLHYGVVDRPFLWPEFVRRYGRDGVYIWVDELKDGRSPRWDYKAWFNGDTDFLPLVGDDYYRPEGLEQIVRPAKAAKPAT
jgi:hypothetical protein